MNCYSSKPQIIPTSNVKNVINAKSSMLISHCIIYFVQFSRIAYNWLINNQFLIQLQSKLILVNYEIMIHSLNLMVESDLQYKYNYCKIIIVLSSP